MRTAKAMLVLVAVVMLTARAAAEEPKAVIARAIKAHGGEELLTKFQASRTKGKGTVVLNGMDVPFTQEGAFMFPDRIREVMELEVMGQKVRVVSLFDGTRASLEVNGKEMDVNDKMLDALKDAGRLVRISRLVSLLKDPAFQLSALPEAKIGDKAAVGVKVAVKDRPDVSLFFDKDSGLLLKAERRGTDPASGQEFVEERLVSGYQNKDGLQMPRKATILRDGKKFMEIDVVEVTNLEKLDDKEFTK